MFFQKEFNVWVRIYFRSLFLQVVFEARRGSGNLGDIAIDDIFVKAGACKPPGIASNDKILDLS